MSKNKTNIYFPNLDALRFFCFLSVFFHHSFHTTYNYILQSDVYRFVKINLFENGRLGVNFFFVLSGFLITYLLLAERSKKNRIHIGNFYIRRMLRIWPLFFFCVLFGFVAFPLFKSLMGATPNETANVLYYLFFLNNIDFIQNGADSSVLTVLWSVAIEEQFYLVWPLLIAFIRPRYLPFVFVLLLGGSFVYRYLHSYNDNLLEFHTFSCISDMTIGGLGAYLSFYSKRFLNSMKQLSRPAILFIYLSAIVLYLFHQHIFGASAFLRALDRLVISLVFLLIILEQNFSEASWIKMKNMRFFSRWGNYTYGLYCLHMIGILIASELLKAIGQNNTLGKLFFLEGSLSLLITMSLAWFSYHYYEKRFLKLKDRFAVIGTSKQVKEMPVSGMTDVPVVPSVDVVSKQV